MLTGITLNDLVASNIWSSQVSWPHSQFINLTMISFLGIPFKQMTRLPHKMRILIKALAFHPQSRSGLPKEITPPGERADQLNGPHEVPLNLCACCNPGWWDLESASKHVVALVPDGSLVALRRHYQLTQSLLTSYSRALSITVHSSSPSDVDKKFFVKAIQVCPKKIQGYVHMYFYMQRRVYWPTCQVWDS